MPLVYIYGSQFQVSLMNAPTIKVLHLLWGEMGAVVKALPAKDEVEMCP